MEKTMKAAGSKADTFATALLRDLTRVAHETTALERVISGLMFALAGEDPARGQRLLDMLDVFERQSRKEAKNDAETAVYARLARSLKGARAPSADTQPRGG